MQRNACSGKSSSPTAARSPSASSAPAASWAFAAWPSTATPTATASHVRAGRRGVPYRPAPAARELPARREAASTWRRRAGAEAIHPGYGFLAENADFAEACARAGMVFIGPRPEAMRALGGKTDARRAMQAAGVPVVPGTVEPVGRRRRGRGRSPPRIGYPIALKAVAGGGGKGMRRGRRAPRTLPSAFRAAPERGARRVRRRRDVPRALRRAPAPRRDPDARPTQHGNVVALGERECSIQRRHQKLIEESPVAGRRRRHCARGMGEVAVRRRARRSATSTPAPSSSCSTRDGEFYFLEVNARLQVEHPVTELVHRASTWCSGRSAVAAGEPLAFRQEDIQPRGAAIECRIYAEDAANGLRPVERPAAGRPRPRRARHSAGRGLRGRRRRPGRITTRSSLNSAPGAPTGPRRHHGCSAPCPNAPTSVSATPSPSTATCSHIPSLSKPATTPASSRRHWPPPLAHPRGRRPRYGHRRRPRPLSSSAGTATRRWRARRLGGPRPPRRRPAGTAVSQETSYRVTVGEHTFDVTLVPSDDGLAVRIGEEQQPAAWHARGSHAATLRLRDRLRERCSPPPGTAPGSRSMGTRPKPRSSRPAPCALAASLPARAARAERVDVRAPSGPRCVHPCRPR